MSAGKIYRNNVGSKPSINWSISWDDNSDIFTVECTKNADGYIESGPVSAIFTVYFSFDGGLTYVYSTIDAPQGATGITSTTTKSYTITGLSSAAGGTLPIRFYTTSANFSSTGIVSKSAPISGDYVRSYPITVIDRCTNLGNRELGRAKYYRDYDTYVSASSLRGTTYVGYTYNSQSSGTYVPVGGTTLYRNFTINDINAPTITLSVAPYNTNSVVNGWGIYLQGYTQLRITGLTATSNNSGASISSRSVTYTGGTTYNPTSNITSSAPYTFSSTLVSAGSITVTASASDSFGGSGTKTTNITVHEYAAPSLTALSIYRCNSSGVASSSGTYVHVSMNRVISSCNGNNTSTMTVDYKVQGSSSFTNRTTTTNASFSSNFTVTGINDPSKSYVIRVGIKDLITTSYVYYTVTIPAAGTPFNIARGNTGVCIGGYATTGTGYGNSFQIAAGWKFIVSDAIAGTADPSTLSSPVANQVYFKIT